jgi:hypothetical protein
MKLEIKLSDPKYCNGCPCFIKTHSGCYNCQCHWIVLKTEYIALDLKIIRPKICKETNGI